MERKMNFRSKESWYSPTAGSGRRIAVIVALLASVLVLTTSSPASAETDGCPLGTTCVSAASGGATTPVQQCNVVTEVVAGITDDEGYSGDGGEATMARLDSPHGVAVGSDGSVYIAASRNNAVRKVDPSGIIRTIAGTGAYGFAGDGGDAAAADLRYPTDVAVDANENVFIVDQGNHRIRRIDAATNVITTVVGTTAGFSGDFGSPVAAQLNQPTAIAFDSSGALWIADGTNSVIRKVDPTFSTIETVVGTPETWGYDGDGGPAGSAKLATPDDLTFGPDGYLYIADTGNHRIRRVGAGPGFPLASSSPIETVAGTGVAGWSSDDTALGTDFDLPSGVAVSPDGATLYISASNNHSVFAMNLATDAIEWLPTSVSLPARLDVTSGGQLFIADAANHRVVTTGCETQLTLTKVVDGGTANVSDFTLTANFDQLTPATYVPGATSYSCPAGTAAFGSGASLTCVRDSFPTVVCPSGATLTANGACKGVGFAGRDVSGPGDCSATEVHAVVLGADKCFPIVAQSLVCSAGTLVTTSFDEICREYVPNVSTTAPGYYTCSQGTLMNNMCAVSGSTNFTSGVTRTVSAGDFVLSESGGPSGYTASDWVCQKTDAQGASTTLTTAGPVAINEGDRATCTITNTFVGPPCGNLTATIVAVPGVLTRGTPGNDVIVGTAGRDIIRGMGGNDTICGLGGNDVLLGDDGSDAIFGGDGNDNIWAGNDDDEVHGGNGIDRIRAGAGDDLVFGGADRDVILGEAGIDVIHGEAGRDSLYGGSEDDWIDGGADTDLVRGQGGDDELFSGPSGNDRLVGGTDNDTLDARATTGSTRLIGDSGNDTFYGSEQLDRMWGGVGNDLMYAGGYHDLLRGGDGDDTIFGEAGRDVIDGGNNNDYLDGGLDNDRIYGMAGIDTCVGGHGAANFIHYLTCEYLTAAWT